LRSDLEHPVVCYVTDGHGFLPRERQLRIFRQIKVALDAGADWIQIREKDLSAKLLLGLTREAVALAQHAGSARIIVNGRLDVALAARARGVHLGAETIPADAVTEWRETSGIFSELLLGVSCHGVEDAKNAEAAGANYIFFGPVFETPTKRRFGKPQGVDRLGEVCRAVSIPVLAIGGIDESNAERCLRAGAKGVAAIRLFQEGRSPETLRQIVRRMHSLG